MICLLDYWAKSSIGQSSVILVCCVAAKDCASILALVTASRRQVFDSKTCLLATGKSFAPSTKGSKADH